MAMDEKQPQKGGSIDMRKTSSGKSGGGVEGKELRLKGDGMKSNGEAEGGKSVDEEVVGMLQEKLVSQAPANLVTAAGETFAESCQPPNSPVGILTHSDGTLSNIPASMLNDQFGMAGLLAYLRCADNSCAVALALGYDLTTFGVNLNSSDRKELYTTFGGPWAESPIKPAELDVKVPEEYTTNTHIREKLPPVKLNKMSDDVLFYLFFNSPGEVYQLASAVELYHRDWRFHKGEGLWLTRSNFGQSREQTGTYEKGSYTVFDHNQWRKIPREMKLEYKDLDERPCLPSAMPIADAPVGVNGGATTVGGRSTNNGTAASFT